MLLLIAITTMDAVGWVHNIGAFPDLKPMLVSKILVQEPFYCQIVEYKIE